MDLRDDVSFPWEMRDLEPDEKADLGEYFKSKFVHVGPKNYLLREEYKTIASGIYNLKLESSDVFVLGFPRSGTTWIQELVWLLENGIDMEKAEAIKTIERVPFLERTMFCGEERQKQLREDHIADKEYLLLLDNVLQPPLELMAGLPSPRIVKSHLPLSLLPPALLDTARVVYIARDPRDVAVSYYHLFKNDTPQTDDFSDFKMYWESFIKNALTFTPYFENVKEAWDKRHHPRMLFLFYEELSEDLPTAVRRVARFLDKQLTDEQVDKLCDYLSFSNLKKTKSVNDSSRWKLLGGRRIDQNLSVRKGKVGGWRDCFDSELAQRAERWIADNLRGTDLRFPSAD